MKNIDLTFKEYLEIVNPSQKTHDSDSYSGNIELYDFEEPFSETIFL